MFHDARRLPAGTVLDVDICVIGAGAAGIALAHGLRGGPRVALLESGGMELEAATQALHEGELRGVPNYPPDISRLRYFGGTTNHWAGWCRPLDAEDFVPADPADPRAWPFPRDVLAPYYAAAQALCELGPADYDSLAPWLAEGGLAALAVDPRRLKTALFQVSPPTRFGARHGPALAAAGNIAVYLHANAIEIETDASAARVTGVRARGLAGPEFRVSARHVVLAAGGLENARLLLLSNRVQAAGLGNGHDQVGRHFMDHPWLFDAGFLAFTGTPPDLRLYFDETPARGTTVFGALAPGAREPGIGGFRVVLRPARRVVEGVESLKAIGRAAAALEVPPRFWDHLGQVFSDYDAVIDSAFKTVFGTKWGLFNSGTAADAPIVGATLDVNVEQFPDPASRVVLSDRRDALGQRRLVLDWRPGAREKRTFARAVELVAQEAGRLGLGRVRARGLPSGGAWPDDLQGSRHHMGTTRMSPTPRTGVVDADCRVHGIANLHVAGSSVFPGAGYANPTLTIVALALRLADTLRQK